jgi:iron-sulfur cluster insertion protein
MNAVAEAQEVIPAPIIFTDSAAGKVAQLIEEEGNPALKRGVGGRGGGSSGAPFVFMFD